MPGDIIEIRDNLILPCDVILLNGYCIMNEEMLTGESIPTYKYCLPENKKKYDINTDGKYYTLFAGTLCV